MDEFINFFGTVDNIVIKGDQQSTTPTTEQEGTADNIVSQSAKDEASTGSSRPGEAPERPPRTPNNLKITSGELEQLPTDIEAATSNVAPLPSRPSDDILKTAP